MSKLDVMARMSKIDEEKHVVELMIRLYCRNRHTLKSTSDSIGRTAQRNGLCQECTELLEYAHERLGRCPFGDGKTSCRQCSIHCYAPEKREGIRMVMRYSGPRMLWHHPIAALRHMYSEFKH